MKNTEEDDFMATIDTGAYVQAKMSYLLTAYEGQDMRLKSNTKIRIVKVEAE